MVEVEASEILLSFQVNGFPPEKFALTRMEGREAISELYEFAIDLVSADPDIDLDKVVNQSAVVLIDRDGDISRFHGIVTIFEQRSMGPEFVNYHAVLVPRLHNLAHTKQCQVFLDKDVKTILNDVLVENGLAEDKDFSILLKETYPRREYVLQYQESDLDFISRQMEHYGIFYFFEHGESKEKLIITDRQEAPGPIEGEPEIPFRDARAIDPAGEAVSSLVLRQRQLSKQVLLKDYNYRNPSVEIKGNADVIPKGFGTYMEYGDHFKTPEEGSTLARVRMEEQLCRQKMYYGESACRHFRSGATFSLIDHFRSTNNMKYLLLDVNHSATQLGIVGSAYGGAPEKPSYLNTFTAIPASVMFRPARLTPRPQITGIMHATVDADASGQYAEIDEMGRYKVKLPFDLSNAAAGKASHYVRMSQPYSGSEYGMHFPLHKDTEVLLVHLDGDPDRPIISGTVPNPNNASPVTAGNKTQCRIRTGSDNEMLIEDTAGSEYILIRTPNEDTHLSIGADHHSNHAPPGVTMGSKAGVSINAGKGVTITAGSANHDEGVSTQGSNGGKVAGVAATVAGVAAAVGGSGADLFAGGLAAALPSLIGDVGGFVAGVTLPGIYMSAPGKAGITAGGEVVIGAIGSADMIALGPANVLSVAGAMIAGARTAAVVSLGKVEVVSAYSDIMLHAKKKNIKIHAKQNVTIDADTKNLSARGHENVTLMAVTGWARLSAKKQIFIKSVEENALFEAHKDIQIESKDTKKIELTAGKSVIGMDNDSITLTAAGKKVIVNAAEEIELKCGESSIKLTSGGEITLQGKKLLFEGEDGTMTLDGKGFDLAGDTGSVSSTNLTLEAAAAGSNTIKGGMVKIN